MRRIIGIISLGVGILLLLWGHDMAQSIGGQLQNAVTGSPGDKSMHLYIGGAALSLLGLSLIFWKK